MIELWLVVLCLVVVIHEFLHYVSAKPRILKVFVDLKKGKLGFKVKCLTLRDLLVPQVINPFLGLLVLVFPLRLVLGLIVLHLLMSLQDIYLAIKVLRYGYDKCST